MRWTLQAKGEITPVSFSQDWEPHCLEFGD
jgi:hypothetical protein